MNNTGKSTAELLAARAIEDSEFRARLIADPKLALEQEFGATIAGEHRIQVHEDSRETTHLVLPPPDKYSTEERRAMIAGNASLAFLGKTLSDPAPPLRPPASKPSSCSITGMSSEALVRAGLESIRRGLDFLESAIGENGAWHCIRFNVANPDTPRHYERPAFITAFCALALARCGEARARAICARSLNHLIETMEYPGLWRYYRHLPQDLDSTSLCSLLIGSHPWILLGKNLPQVLANRDEEGRFLTWVLAENEPDVAARFRIEADPVVNANIVAWLGDRPETRSAQRWLETLIREDRLRGASKWYPDPVTIYYSIARAMIRAAPVFDHLRPLLAERILAARDEQEGFGDILRAAQAVSSLSDVDALGGIDLISQFEQLLCRQNEDGGWPELLAFGDQTLRWGVLGQFGHGSEMVTTAFCIEALQCLVEAHGA